MNKVTKKLVLKKSVLKNITSKSSLNAVFGGTVVGGGDPSSLPQLPVAPQINNVNGANQHLPFKLEHS
ncbi:hypothetical protein ACSLBF_12780 [Pseudoalteromonas sp. T1lg65]|uniref:hypothetical protein n=1 Tax=Pseudoalteromonas sp. T1lg65 TaxID=2077101 RepID=UPI003F78FE8B